jgi:hypothetical protein
MGAFFTSLEESRLSAEIEKNYCLEEREDLREMNHIYRCLIIDEG